MNIEALKNFEAFINIARHRSLKAASKATGASRQTLRTRMADFEAAVGADVLVRNARGLELTAIGSVLFEHGQSIFAELENTVVQAAKLGRSEDILNIAVPVGHPTSAALMFFDLLRSTFPSLRFNEIISADPASELGRGADIAVCLSPTKPEGPWTSVRLMTVHQKLMASPAYLDTHGTPQSPEDLKAHALLAWSVEGVDPTVLPISQGPDLLIEPVLACADDQRLLAFAQANKGIAFIPHVPGPFTDYEGLVPILPKIVYRKLGVRVVMPKTLGGLKRVRLALTVTRRLAGAQLASLFQRKAS